MRVQGTIPAIDDVRLAIRPGLFQIVMTLCNCFQSSYTFEGPDLVQHCNEAPIRLCNQEMQSAPGGATETVIPVLDQDSGRSRWREQQFAPPQVGNKILAATLFKLAGYLVAGLRFIFQECIENSGGQVPHSCIPGPQD